MKRLLSHWFGVSCAAAVFVLSSGVPYAGDDEGGTILSGLRIGTCGGTTGFGFEGAVELNEFCQVRAGRSSLGFGVSSTYRAIPYRYESDLSWTSAVLDLYPGSGRFHFTAGAYFGDSDVEVTASGIDLTSAGGLDYSAEQLGEIRGRVTMPEVAPYFGIGFGGRPARDPGLHLTTEVGLIFQDYTVDLWHEGGSLPPELQQQLADSIEVEQSFLQGQFDRVSVYPVISLSLSCRF